MIVEQMFTAEDVAARWKCRMVIIEQCNYGFIDKAVFFMHDAREVTRSDFKNSEDTVAIFKVKRKERTVMIVNKQGQLKLARCQM
jgi:hypothetical protein